jgi:hypothetical protein
LPSETTTPVSQSLLDRLPATFVPVLNEQLANWGQLFPAEQRPIRTSMEYLDALPEEQFRALLKPIFDLEAKMDLASWSGGRSRLSIQDTSRLARSPQYPQWRVEVEKLFDNIHQATTKAEDPVRDRNKLVVNIMPAGLPGDSGQRWQRMAKHGRWHQLAEPFGDWLHPLAGALAGRENHQATEPIEHTWILESVSELTPFGDRETVTLLSFEALEKTRVHFSRKLNEIDKVLESLDETYTELRSDDLTKLLPAPARDDLRLREFIRELFLSGNGAVQFCNSFVQWGASEILRRAEPQALICYFGIRDEIKPFSGLVLFEDQSAANPVPYKADPKGSLIDIEILGEYIYRTAVRLPNYRGRTATIFAAADSDMMLLVAPKTFPELPGVRQGPLDSGTLQNASLEWLAAT